MKGMGDPKLLGLCSTNGYSVTPFSHFCSRPAASFGLRPAPAPTASAAIYTLGQWDELAMFTRDGAVPIDNNASEREMKRVVLNRKNSLFVGNPRGGRTFLLAKA